MTLLEEVKQSLRVKTKTYDEEITSILEAGKKDLGIAGVQVVEDEDALTKRALILYAKAQFGYQDESEKYWKAYSQLRNTMAIAGDYHEKE